MRTRLYVMTLAAVVVATPIPLAAQDASPATPAVIRVTARKYEFEPSTITVKKGALVRLEVTAVDTTHGIEIKDFGVKRELKKGRTEVIEFTPDRAGSFPMKCSKFCGLGHGKMKGTFVVTE